MGIGALSSFFDGTFEKEFRDEASLLTQELHTELGKFPEGTNIVISDKYRYYYEVLSIYTDKKGRCCIDIARIEQPRGSRYKKEK
jgi:hypothetical protein